MGPCLLVEARRIQSRYRSDRTLLMSLGRAVVFLVHLATHVAVGRIDIVVIKLSGRYYFSNIGRLGTHCVVPGFHDMQTK